jgi:hypothetical protein
VTTIYKRLLQDGAERYDVAFYDPAAGRKRCKTFTRAGDATNYAAAIDAEPSLAARWPLEPLLQLTGFTSGGLADYLGIGRTTVGRAARYGLTDAQADEWAIGCGYHPINVWGWAWIDAALAAPDEQTEAVA